MHRCEICSGVFTQRSVLKRHVHTVHGKPQHHCGLCDTTFSQLTKYNIHLKNRKNCPHCDHTCCGKRALFNHIKIIHREKPTQYQCELCDTSFSRVERYNIHLKNQENCPHCDHTCCGKRALANHSKIIHREKPSQYRCELCNTTFTQKTWYNIHLKNRKNCPHCDLTCCGKHALSNHIKIIHREKLSTSTPTASAIKESGTTSNAISNPTDSSTGNNLSCL